MKLPLFKRILRSEMPDAPDWIARLLLPINNVFETVYNTLNRNLTFQDNFVSFTKSLEFTTSASYSSGEWSVLRIAIPDHFKVRVQGVLILQLLPKNASSVSSIAGVYVAWQQSDRVLEITWLGGLDDGATYNVSLLVI